MSERLGPPDPSRFRDLRRGDTFTLSAPTRLARLFPTSGPYPVRWNEFRTVGPVLRGRFDHHEGTATGRGIWYAAAGRTPAGRRADAVLGAVAETFGDVYVVDRAAAGRHLALCVPSRPLLLLRLDSGWLPAARGNAAIFAGPRPRAQEWSRAIYDRYPELDGLVHPSSVHPSSACVALYERAADAISVPLLLRPLTEPGLVPYLQRAADALGWPVV